MSLFLLSLDSPDTGFPTTPPTGTNKISTSSWDYCPQRLQNASNHMKYIDTSSPAPSYQQIALLSCHLFESGSVVILCVWTLTSCRQKYPDIPLREMFSYFSTCSIFPTRRDVKQILIRTRRHSQKWTVVLRDYYPRNTIVSDP